MIIASSRFSLLFGVLNTSVSSLEDLYEKGKIQVQIQFQGRPSLASMHFKNASYIKMNQFKVFENYNKFVPPSHPHVLIDLKIDLTGVNKVEPANSFFDGNFLLRVKWQARGSSHFF